MNIIPSPKVGIEEALRIASQPVSVVSTRKLAAAEQRELRANQPPTSVEDARRQFERVQRGPNQ